MSSSSIKVETSDKPQPQQVAVVQRRGPLTFKRFVLEVLAEFFLRVTSRKLWMAIFCIGVLWATLERGVNHLYAMDWKIAGIYGVMFLSVLSGITVIAAKYMGIENISVSSATSISGSIGAAANTSFERHEDDIHERIEQHVIDESSRNENLRANRDENTASQT